MLKRVIVLILTGLVVWPIVITRAAGQLSTALNYLQIHYTEQSGANQDWAAIALGESGITVSPAATNTSNLLSVERNVLARSAQGTDRNSQIAQIESAYQNDQFGTLSLINDDIFGVLAVATADTPWLASHQGVFTTIAASQRGDGSFGFSTSGSGDGDITSAAIWALALASTRPTTALNSATTFLQNCRNSDGGFGVEPGEVSNVATSAWAMIAENSIGNDTSGVRNYLLSAEQSGGFWLEGSSANYLNTAYAAMALSGEKIPFIKRSPTTPTQNITPAPISSRQPSNSPNTKTPTTVAPKIPTGQITTPAPKPAVKRTSRHPILQTTTNTTFQVFSCSASASASAGEGYASATASASCN